MLRFCVVAIALLLPLGAAVADEGQPSDPDQKIVCHSEQVLGSNLPKRVCRTKADWKAIAAANRQQTDRDNALDRARTSTSGIGRPD